MAIKNITNTEISAAAFTWNGDTVATQPWVTANVGTPTLDTVTTAGNTTTNNITVGPSLFVGQGITTASAYLELGNGRTANGYAYIDLVGDATYTDYGLRVIRYNTGANAASAIDHRGTGTFTIETNEAAPIAFKTTNAERMRITAAGNIGIGATAPANTLDVNGVANFAGGTVGGVIDTHNAGVYLSTQGRGLSGNFQGYARNLISSIGSGIIEIGQGTSLISNIRLYAGSSSANGIITFFTNGAEKMRLTQDGNLGIGTTSPTYPLEVQSGGVGTVLRAGTSFVSIDSTGSATSPSLIFNGDTNTGLYRPAVDTLAAVTNGSERMRIDSSGNVGIGGSPASVTHGPHLDIVGNRGTLTVGTGYFEDNGSTNFLNGARPLAFGYSGSEYMRVHSNGNVGIGTTSPAAELHVKGAGEVIRLQGDTGQSYMTFFQGTGSRVGYLGTAGSAGIILESSDQLQLYAGSSERMRITAAGDVGIGTTSPENLLHVKAADGVSGVIKIEGGNSVVTANGEINSRLEFGSNDGSVNSSGNVGGSIASVTESSNGAITGLAFSTFYQSRTPNDLAEAMRITGAGDVGIGTTSPGYKLDVAGDIRSSGAFRGVNIALSGYIDLTGHMNHRSNIRVLNKLGTNWITWATRDTSGSDSKVILSNVGGDISQFTNDAGYLTSETDTLATVVARGAYFGTTNQGYVDGGGTYGTNLRKIERITLTSGGSNWNSDNHAILSKGLSGAGADSISINSYNGIHLRLDSNNNNANNTTAFTIHNDTTTSSNELFRINGDGNVGIGTTSPIGMLSVVNPINNTNTWTPANNPDLWVSNSGTSNSYYAFGITTNSGDILSVTNAGNVGIGTTSPSTNLQTGDGSAGLDTAVRAYHSDGAYTEIRGYGLITNRTTAYIRPIGDKNAIMAIGNDNNTWNYVSINSNYFTVSTDTTEHLRVTNTGNVGIGTTSPSGKLHIKPDASSEFIFTGASTSGYATTFHMDNTGLDIGHNSTSRALNLKTGSLDRLTILGNGNVGIGTTSPGYTLDVNGSMHSTNITIADAVYHEGDTNTYISFGTDTINLNTGGGTRAIINNSGAKFNNDVVVAGGATLSLGERAEPDDLGRTVLIEGAANASNGEGAGRIFFTEHNSTTAGADSYGLSLYYEGDPNIALPSGFQPNQGNATWSLRRHDNSVNGVPIMSGSRSNSNVQFGGNITIGSGVTLSESTDRADLLSINSSTSGWGGLQITNTNGEGIWSFMVDNDAAGIYDDQNGDWAVYCVENSYVQLRHNNSGKLTTTSTGVDVTGTLNALGGTVRSQYDGSNYSQLESNASGGVFKALAAGATNILLRSYGESYFNGGNVGIGTTSPSEKLEVSGNILASGDITAFSDANLKENVETVSDALDKVKGMRGVTFNKIGEEKRSVGVIAQELLEVLPEAVRKSGEHYSVAYGNIVGVLIEAMKEQQAQIDELKAMINGSTK